MLAGTAPQAGEAATPKPILFAPYAAHGEGSNPQLKAQPWTAGPEETPTGFSPSLADLSSPRASSLPRTRCSSKKSSRRRAELMQYRGKANLELAEPKSLHFQFLAFGGFLNLSIFVPCPPPR